MPNISDSLQHRNFAAALAKCERKTHLLNNWEQQFVEGLAEKFATREFATDLGMTPWNPTTNQWNTLMDIARKV